MPHIFQVHPLKMIQLRLRAKTLPAWPVRPANQLNIGIILEFRVSAGVPVRNRGFQTVMPAGREYLMTSLHPIHNTKVNAGGEGEPLER